MNLANIEKLLNSRCWPVRLGATFKEFEFGQH
nr:MAG TPA: hypothetical protein [Caudoviricetes sp.]DAU12934.1 MAG TPA: hypothetical protein [Caudoviricetes sp.]